MALLKKAQPYRVPSLADVDDNYASLLTKRAEIQQRLWDLISEQDGLLTDLAGDRNPVLRPGVSALLGDHENPRFQKHHRVDALKGEIADCEAALLVIARRLNEAKPAANTKACEQVKPEFAKRVAALCKALEELDVAHREYDQLRWQFEAEDIAWTRLGVFTPGFLGASNDPDRRITRFLKQAEEAGYYHAKG